MSDTQWIIVSIVIGFLLIGNAYYLFRAKQRNARHRSEVSAHLRASIEHLATPSRRIGTPVRPWKPAQGAVSSAEGSDD